MDSLSYDARLDRIKQDHKLSPTLQRLSNSFTDSFESDLREFEASASTSSSTSGRLKSTTDETPAVEAGNRDIILTKINSRRRGTQWNNFL